MFMASCMGSLLRWIFIIVLTSSHWFEGADLSIMDSGCGFFLSVVGFFFHSLLSVAERNSCISNQ
ncbi:hypothetical protein QBC38DRAFT_493474, partial [Podospora fimiseda]